MDKKASRLKTLKNKKAGVKRKVVLSPKGKRMGRPPKTDEITKPVNFRLERSTHETFLDLTEFNGFKYGVDYFKSLIKKEKEKAIKKGYKEK